MVGALSRASLGGALGLCWGAPAPWLALTPGLCAIWGSAGSRLGAWAAAAGYYGVALRGVPRAADQFWSTGALGGLLAWLLWVGLLSGVWAALWSRRLRVEESTRWKRVASVLLLLSAPGVGSVGVATPLVGAGMLLPGAGLMGLAILVWLCVGMPALRLRAACFSLLALLGLCTASESNAASAFDGLQTSVAVARSSGDWVGQGRAALAMMSQVPLVRGRVTVLPEGAGGVWTREMQGLWRPLDLMLEAADAEALVPALVPVSRRYDAAVVVLGVRRGGDRYLQRQPMPIAMWWPGSGGVRSHWLSSGVVEVGAQRAGILVCFEQLLVWPVVQSVLEGAEVLVGASNGRWLAGTHALEAQQASLTAWGLLFGLPVVSAVNR